VQLLFDKSYSRGTNEINQNSTTSVPSSYNMSGSAIVNTNGVWMTLQTSSKGVLIIYAKANRGKFQEGSKDVELGRKVQRPRASGATAPTGNGSARYPWWAPGVQCSKRTWLCSEEAQGIWLVYSRSPIKGAASQTI
jgi:hypothetical protein